MNDKEKLKLLNHSITVVVGQIEKLEVENKKITAENDQLAAEVARLNGVLDGWDAASSVFLRALTLEQCGEAFRAFEAAHTARQEGEA